MSDSSKKKAKVPRIEISIDECKGCELCIEACPKKTIKLSKKFNKLGYLHAEQTEDGCIGCAICFYACPEPGAITVIKPKKDKK